MTYIFILLFVLITIHHYIYVIIKRYWCSDKVLIRTTECVTNLGYLLVGYWLVGFPSDAVIRKKGSQLAKSFYSHNLSHTQNNLNS